MVDIDIGSDFAPTNSEDGFNLSWDTEGNVKVPLPNVFDILSPFANEDQKGDGLRSLKKAPTDFITTQDWSLYVRICCHLRQIQTHYGYTDLDAYRKREAQNRSGCIVRLVAAFNRLYTEYSLLCDTVKMHGDHNEPPAESQPTTSLRKRNGRSLSLMHRGRGDDGRSMAGSNSLLQQPSPKRINHVDFQSIGTASDVSIANGADTCSTGIQFDPLGSCASSHCTQTPGTDEAMCNIREEETPITCCALMKSKSEGPNSPDMFDCIQRQSPDSSIWVKQIKRTTLQTILTTDCQQGQVETQVPEEASSKKAKKQRRGDNPRTSTIRLPIALELTLPRIQRQVQTIMAICPFVFDPLEAIAELRASNYDTDECVAYFERTKALREIIQEFLPTRVLRPEVVPERLVINAAAEKPPSTATAEVEARVFGMTEAEVEAFLLHYKQRIVTIRKLQKDAVRRIQRLHTFSSGLTSVMQQIIPAGGFPKTAAAIPTQEVATERNKELSVKLSCLSVENVQLKETLKKEEERRKLIFNMMQEYLGNIRVFCRCRAIPQTGRILEVTSFDTVTLNGGTGVEEYKFDRAFDTNSTQAEIYTELVPLICSFMDGFNVSFLTYGGESSGKTYTLLGGPDGTPESQGVVYRALRTVLAEKECRKNDWDIGITIGAVEVYNDTLIDVISGESGIHIRVDAGVDRMLDTLKTVDVQNEDEVDQLLRFCKAKRKIARTALNEASSRSHLIILVRLRAISNIYQKNISSVLAMCDLAGFEDIIKADTLGDQTLAKEAGFINKSLTALNRVFTSLKTQNPTTVSYRDSKLTYLLKPFFTNSGKCILIVTVRTDKANMPSTQGTLRFGRDSRAVSLGRARRQISMEKLIQDVRTV